MAELAVLLRDGTNAGATIRLALKVEQFSVGISKTPIQVPVPRGTPILMDLGSSRPSITMSGVVDNIGQDTSNTTSNFWHMETKTIQGQTYYVPYKNYLENKLITWVTGSSVDLQVEIGDASVTEATSPAVGSSNAPTGGGIYKVAVQQVQFAVMPAQEDRWTFNVQFVGALREGISF